MYIVSIELGGNITLVGFSEKEFTELIVVKKMVGQYARKLSDSVGLDTLKVTHKGVGNSKSEVNILAIIEGKEYNSSVTDPNIYVAIDTAMKKIVSQAK